MKAVTALVETPAALQQIDAIAAVDGVDGIFIGPADLSTSMGHSGKPAHPEVMTAIDDAIVRIRRAGKAAGILTTDNVLARRFIERGTTFTAVGVDAALRARAADRLHSAANSASGLRGDGLSIPFRSAGLLQSGRTASQRLSCFASTKRLFVISQTRSQPAAGDPLGIPLLARLG